MTDPQQDPRYADIQIESRLFLGSGEYTSFINNLIVRFVLGCCKGMK